VADRIAILLDGGFVKKKLHERLGRFPTVADIVGFSSTLMTQQRLRDARLFRAYYYDAPPFEGTARNPIDGAVLNFIARLRRNRMRRSRASRVESPELRATPHDFRRAPRQLPEVVDQQHHRLPRTGPSSTRRNCSRTSPSVGGRSSSPAGSWAGPPSGIWLAPKGRSLRKTSCLTWRRRASTSALGSTSPGSP